MITNVLPRFYGTQCVRVAYCNLVRVLYEVSKSDYNRRVYEFTRRQIAAAYLQRSLATDEPAIFVYQPQYEYSLTFQLHTCHVHYCIT